MIIKSTKNCCILMEDHYKWGRKQQWKICINNKIRNKRYYLEEIFIDDSYLNFINNCIGCKTALNWIVMVITRMELVVKNKLLGADIIVISTPIFIDNISGAI